MEDWMLFFIPVGILFLLGSIFWIIGFSMSRRSRNWLQTIGVVIDSVKPTSDSSWRPVFEFEAEDGKTYEVTSNVGQSPSIPDGKEVPVLYDPKNPSRARIDSAVQSGRFFMILGTIFLVIAAIIFLIVWIAFT